MSEQTELPHWRCHKVVQAAKIETVSRRVNTEEPVLLTFEGGGHVFVNHTYVARAPTGIDGGGPKALVGGYYVRYEDGYESWSPAKAFEEGYHRVEAAPNPDGLDL